MRRLVLALTATVMLTVTPISVPVAALGEVQANLSCSDGITTTDTAIVADLATLSDLKSAVEAMTVSPAGLTCTLTTSPLASGLGLIAFASNGPGDFAVGGGQLFDCAVPTTAEFLNFGLSAHSDADNTLETAQGSLVVTGKDCAGGAPREHSKSRITCLAVVTALATPEIHDAYMYGEIQQATGEAAPYNHIRAHATDNGNGLIPDQLGFGFFAGPPDVPAQGCPMAVGTGTVPLSKGNIVIRDR